MLEHEYESWEQLFGETQKPHLLAAAYSEDEIIGVEAFPVTPTADCEYYSHDTAMVHSVQRSFVENLPFTTTHSSGAAHGAGDPTRAFV